MADLSKKSALVLDLSGSFSFVAEALAEEMSRVFYTSVWETGFPDLRDFFPGMGLDNIIRIKDPFEYLDRIDLAVFPDVGLDHMQEYLRRQGIAVWGSGAHGRLERDRVFLKQTLAGLGMDVAKYTVIHGLAALRLYLAEHKDLWVKISWFRGLSETHHHISGFASEGWCDDLSVKLGPYQHVMEFLVEEPIEGDAVEVGIDSHVIDGELPATLFWGYEQKDSAFLGTIADASDRLTNVSKNLLPALVDYRGPLSTEVRVTEEHDYLVDLTARMPSPPSEIQVMNMTNFAQVVYDGAHGIQTEPDYKYRYAAQLVLTSDVIEEHPLGILVGMPERVAIHGHCRFNDRDYAASPLRIHEFAGAVGLANKLETAIAEAIEAAESVEGNHVKFDASALDRCMETIEQGDKIGLLWT
jgi:hypothetical protein